MVVVVANAVFVATAAAVVVVAVAVAAPVLIIAVIVAITVVEATIDVIVTACTWFFIFKTQWECLTHTSNYGRCNILGLFIKCKEIMSILFHHYV